MRRGAIRGAHRGSTRSCNGLSVDLTVARFVASFTQEALDVADQLVSGRQARLTYTVSGDMPTLMVYLIAKGESLGASAGLPEVSVDRAGSGSAMVANTGGDYYLDVSSFGCSWRLTFEEQP